MTKETTLVIAGLIAFAPSCGSDEDPGDAPSLESLALDEATLQVGSQNVVSGTLGFVDPDGDVLEAGIEIRLPDGRLQMLPPTAVAAADGLLEGTVALTLAIVPPMAGDYELAIWLVDAAGNESNRMSSPLSAE